LISYKSYGVRELLHKSYGVRELLRICAISYSTNTILDVDI